MDELLKQFGLTFEELTMAERETLNGMVSSINKNVLTIERLKDYIHSMRDSVEHELSDPNIALASNQDLFLKARLRNYMLLEAFLLSPQKAAAVLKQQLSSIKKK